VIDRNDEAPERAPMVFAPKPLLCTACGQAKRCRPCGGRGEMVWEPMDPEAKARLT
jgi:hypothetical protein